MPYDQDISSVLWTAIGKPGHETAHIYGDDDGWYLDGVAVFLYERQPVRMDYLIECDPEWRTFHISIDGWIGQDPVGIEIDVEDDGIWMLNGARVAAVERCVDIDLNFSPITNTLPLRRLNISPGHSEKVRAAWLRFPSFRLELLEQTYTRVDEKTVRYESSTGFTADIEIDANCIVIDYPDGWSRIG